MAGPGVPGAPTARWKRHIVRQLRLRDRTQKALFLELVPAYNHLLEKAELLDTFSKKLQPEPNSVTPTTHQGPWEESGLDSDQVPSLATLRVKWQEEEEGLRLVCGEMAYQVVEKSVALGALESELQELQSRLAALEVRVAQLREARAQQAQQVEDRRAQNAVQREAYEALRAHVGLREAALRRLQEEARDLLERLVQRKARAAAERNLRNERRERAKQARVSQELKKAAKRIVSISEGPDTLGDGMRERTETLALAPEPEPLENEACEKWKRPFRSASATSLTLSHCVDVVKGLLDFKKRRGHSIGGAPEQRYQIIPVCVATRLPTQAQDVLDAHLSEVNAVRFGPNSSLLATGGADRLIHLWNVVGSRLEVNQTLEGAGGSITSVDFDPSGYQVLAATYNQAAQLWKVGEAQSKGASLYPGHPCAGPGHLPEPQPRPAAPAQLFPRQHTQGHRPACQQHPPGVQVPASCLLTLWPLLGQLSLSSPVIDPLGTLPGGPSRPGPAEVPNPLTEWKLWKLPAEELVVTSVLTPALSVLRADGFKCGSDWTKAVFRYVCESICLCPSVPCRTVCVPSSLTPPPRFLLCCGHYSPDRSYALAGSCDGALYIWDVDTGKLESRLQGPHW
uniref:Autophagy related 16 like 2 n=1 Tax=Piliocolobus tephrosceles TaxID=591936 RepID=A0A8C9HK51_9PRIM